MRPKAYAARHRRQRRAIGARGRRGGIDHIERCRVDRIGARVGGGLRGGDGVIGVGKPAAGDAIAASVAAACGRCGPMRGAEAGHAVAAQQTVSAESHAARNRCQRCAVRARRRARGVDHFERRGGNGEVCGCIREDEIIALLPRIKPACQGNCVIAYVFACRIAARAAAISRCAGDRGGVCGCSAVDQKARGGHPRVRISGAIGRKAVRLTGTIIDNAYGRR